MKIGYALLGFAVASIVFGFVLIVLGNIPPWSKDNFVYVIGVMTLFSGVLVCCFGVVAYWRRRQEESRPTS